MPRVRHVRKRGRVRERIIRVLLNHPDGRFSRYQVSKLAGSSYPWVHELLGKLASQRLVKGTQVLDYAGLLDYWRRVRLEPARREYLFQEPIALLREAGLPYALTTYHAENLVQHYLFPSRTDIYVKEEDAQRWDAALTEEGLVGQGNVRLLVADEYVFYGSFERQGVRVVSLPQLIADLLDEGGVCVEAAEMLLEKVQQDALPPSRG